MTREGRAAAAAEQIALASEELGVADQLIATGHPRIAVTRAYFAAFHAACALLYAHGHEPRTHAGTLHLFNLHFVKTGQFEPATSRLLSRLQAFREQADYGAAFVIDEAGAREETSAARAFVDRVREAMPRPE